MLFHPTPPQGPISPFDLDAEEAFIIAANYMDDNVKNQTVTQGCALRKFSGSPSGS